MAWMEQLMMQVALVDNVTKPLLAIQQQVVTLGQTVGQGYEQMALGAATVVAGGLAIQAALTPAIEMKQALAEVATPDMTREMLDSLSAAALQFSVDYGQSAVGVLEYTGAMKKALPGLPAAMLESVTQTSAILGAATKSDADTVSQYFRMLYGNYKQSADAMGQSAWAEQVAGQTHLLTQQFGVSMDKMMAAVEGMHSLPSTMGVAMEEQLAILAMLQTRMSDGDAVTQFTNLLEGATAAQDKLGISMVDSQGNLLPIQQILQNIQPLIDQMGGAEAWALLDEAGLGDGALLLQQLIGDAETLDKTLASLKGVSGIDAMSEKLKGTVSQWDRLTAAWYAIRAAAFSSVLPAIEAVVEMFADGASVIVRWTELFPHLTKVISTVVLAIVGLGIATGAWALITALSSMIAKGWAAALLLLKSPITLLSGLLKTFRAVMLAVNLVMYANPAMLIAIAIGVVLVGAIALAIYYWDEIKATLADWGVFEAVAGVIASLSEGWQTFTQYLSDTSVFQMLGDAVGWVIEMLNKIPGVNIEGDFGDMPVPPTLTAPANVGWETVSPPALPALTAQSDIEWATAELPVLPTLTAPANVGWETVSPPALPALTAPTNVGWETISLPTLPALTTQGDIEWATAKLPVPPTSAAPANVGWETVSLPTLPALTIQGDIEWATAELPVPPILTVQTTSEQITAPLARYRQGEPSAVPVGGLGQQLVQANARATAAAQQPGKSMQIGEVHNHFQNPMTPQQLSENLWLETKG